MPSPTPAPPARRRAGARRPSPRQRCSRAGRSAAHTEVGRQRDERRVDRHPVRRHQVEPGDARDGRLPGLRGGPVEAHLAGPGCGAHRASGRPQPPRHPAAGGAGRSEDQDRVTSHAGDPTTQHRPSPGTGRTRAGPVLPGLVSCVGSPCTAHGAQTPTGGARTSTDTTTVSADCPPRLDQRHGQSGLQMTALVSRHGGPTCGGNHGGHRCATGCGSRPAEPVDLAARTRAPPRSPPAASPPPGPRWRSTAARAAELQERLFAEGRKGGERSVLLVLQGMDTSGKGGVIRHVAGLMDPQGLQITSFKAPTPAEKRRGRLPVADPAGAARPRDHRRLRPVALRGRADRAGPQLVARGCGTAATARSTTSRPSSPRAA